MSLLKFAYEETDYAGDPAEALARFDDANRDMGVYEAGNLVGAIPFIPSQYETLMNRKNRLYINNNAPITKRTKDRWATGGGIAGTGLGAMVAGALRHTRGPARFASIPVGALLGALTGRMAGSSIASSRTKKAIKDLKNPKEEAVRVGRRLALSRGRDERAFGRRAQMAPYDTANRIAAAYMAQK